MTALLLLASIPLMMLQDGFVMSRLWDWFAVPAGAPHLGTIAMAGLALFASVARHKPAKPDGKPNVDWTAFAIGVIHPWFCFGLAAFLRWVSR